MHLIHKQYIFTLTFGLQGSCAILPTIQGIRIHAWLEYNVAFYNLQNS